MTIPNMQLEDALAVLGRVGTVTLRKGTNDVSASPGYVANNGGWVCSVSLAGYNNSGGTRSEVGDFPQPPRGMTPTEAALYCLDRLEKYLEGKTGREDRERYERHYETLAELAGQRGDWGRTRKHPGPMIPPAKIDWGD